MDLLWAALASLLAGGIDAIVGGGGLILVPALFAIYPGAPPATLFGTNKAASIWGTGMAALQYGQRVRLRWRVLAPAALVALLGSLLGAWAVTRLDPTFLRRLLPAILLGVLVYTLLNRDLGRRQRLRWSRGMETLLACAMALVIGWYDGFFGPGTGSFLIFLFVRVLGYDFLHASAAAKVINLATGLSALALFAAKGHVWWQVGLVLAVANLAGSLLGTRLALQRGSGFVRAVFVLVVGALIVKTAWDAFVA